MTNKSINKKVTTELNAPLIFKFENLQALADCCSHLFNKYLHIILKSYVYRHKRWYIMVIYTYYKLDKKIAAITGEFGRIIGKGEIKHSYYREHGKTIAEENAIERMSEI